MSEPLVPAAAAGARADVDRAGEPLLRVSGLVKHFPIKLGVVRQKVVGQVRAVDGVTSTSTPARPSGSWASPAAASRPSRRW
jgi:ABC-type microcin C transport system duplicated ATPase subunit YejF